VSQIITKFIKNAAVNLTTKVTGLLPIANGGTGAGTQSAGFDALSPMTTSGDVIYGGTAGTGTRLAKGSDGQFLKLASGLPSWSDPTGGKINYILNANASVSTTGWASYADAAGTTPVDGTGGAPTVTITRDTNSLVIGTTSLLITKDAANRQGEGVSYAFTIDTALKNQPLTITSYVAASANFVFGSENGVTASDIQVYIYDVTNSVLITPFPATVSANGLFQAQFQSTASTSYRLIYHVVSTSALAYTFAMGEVSVSPSQSSFIPLSSDLKDCGALSLSAVTTPPTKGTTSRDKIYYRRDGQYAEFYFQYTQTGAGSAGSGHYLVNLPDGLRIDTDIVPGNTDVASGTVATSPGNVGGGQASAGATNTVGLFGVVVYGATQVRFVGPFGGTQSAWSSSTYALSNADVQLDGFFRVPIKGWTSGFKSSAVVGQNVPENLRASKSATQSLGTGSTTKIVWQTVTHDSAGGWDSSNNRYVVKTPGKFKVTSQVQFETNATGYRDIHVYKNGSAVYTNQATAASSGAFDLMLPVNTPDIEMVVGDYFEIFATQTSGGNLNVVNGNYTFFGVEKVETPQAYMNIRRVATIKDEKAANTDGGTFTSGSFQTRTLNTLVDPFGLVSLSANQFTLQPGTYRIEAHAPAFRVNRHKAKLRNITTSADTIIGTNSFSQSASAYADSYSIVSGVFSITTATVFEIQHRCESTLATFGFGNLCNFGVVEVYTQVEIEKLL